MPKKHLTFDRFARGFILVLSLLSLYFVLDYLSPVLIPFFVAWMAAYLLFPLVRFLQFKLRLRSRLLSIFVTLLILAAVLTGFTYVIVPPFIEEVSNVEIILERYITAQAAHKNALPTQVVDFVSAHLNLQDFQKLLSNGDVRGLVQNVVPKAWGVLWDTAGILLNILVSLMGVLYFFFLLKDYELYAEGWIRYVPRRRRRLFEMVVSDMERGMNGYFRGQALVALSNCLMFSIGFWVIGFPMPIGLGCFIGLISFVPYLQVVGFIPSAVLALLRAADTGQNFWMLLGLVCLVYLVVQILQDSIVTPIVMGNITGLSPAVILLSLSVWGYMLGVLGLIVALPITSLMISYYNRFIIGEDHASKETKGQAESTAPHAPCAADCALASDAFSECPSEPTETPE